MRITADRASNVNVIRGYGGGALRINEDTFRDSMIVAVAAVRAAPAIATVADLTAEHAADIMAFDPELVLLGTGQRQEFPAAAFGARFLAVGIGFEVMDTGAACRTFNVLVGEQRQVVALLML